MSVAPSSSILSVELFGSPSGEVEWMLDRGVNIINTSYGSTSTSTYGEYTSDAAYFDYIVRDSWVTMIGSAGNTASAVDDDGNPVERQGAITLQKRDIITLLLVLQMILEHLLTSHLMKNILI